MASIGSSTTALTQLDDTEFRKELYEAVLKRNWKKFLELCKSNPEKHSTKITRSEDTALHVAIIQGAPEEIVVELVEEINNCATTTETRKKRLSARNNRGDTSLHCAAYRGSRRICEHIVLLDASLELRAALVRMRNEEGETPLFLAAINGYKNTFLYLHSVCVESHCVDSSLWTRRNRDTILHLTIHRQYFDLSLIIIHLYKHQNIANIWNSKGLTPLQTLAFVPTAFESGTYLTWWDRLCYNYIPVPPLVFADDFHAIDMERQTKYAKDDALAESHETRGSLIRKKKEKHVWAAQIMEQLIELNPQYDYSADEISPFQDLSEEDELLRLYQEKIVDTKEKKDVDDGEDQTREEQKPTALLIATKFGLIELVKKILEIRPVAVHDKTPSKKRNIVLVAAENRQPHILKLLMDIEKSLWPRLREAVDDDGNNAMHLAATLPEHMPWEIHGSAMQMQWEVKWFEYVREITPPYLDSQENNGGKTPEEIFAESHKELVKQGNKWLKDTTSSYSIVAALTAGVTYSTSYSVPGGTDDSGKPILQGHPAFKIFSITALLSFCFSITSLAAFLAVYSSRMQPKDFQRSLPLKLCLGLTSFFVSIITMLVSFCAAHSFELSRGNKHQFNPWYTITLLPLCFYAAAQVPLYLDLLRASFTKVPKPKHKGGYVPI